MLLWRQKDNSNRVNPSYPQLAPSCIIASNDWKGCEERVCPVVVLRRLTVEMERAFILLGEPGEDQ